MTKDTHAQRLLRLVESRGIIRTQDADRAGIPRIYLRRLRADGRLVQEARGVYRAADGPVSGFHGYAVAASAVSKGVICLLSALRYHDIGTQIPGEVWLALPRRSAIPRIVYPPLRIVRVSGAAYSEGRMEVMIDQRPVVMTTPAKTVADCFKFRSTIGLDVAIEALRETIRGKKATIDEIWASSGHCRVARVIRPYLEALA